MRVVLITGAYGFVGTNLSDYLAGRDFETWALDVRSQLGGANAKGTYAREFDWEGLEGIPWGEVDAVIHLAGKAHDTRNTSDAKAYFDVNVGLTRKVVEMLVATERKRSATFILFSSVKAVADQVEGVLTEDAVPAPQTPYGRSKLEAEKVVQEAIGKGSKGHTSGQHMPIKSFILRPCMIHGPGNKGNLNLLLRIVGSGLPWPLGAFENRRSFASIGNVCAAVEGLLGGKAAPGVYQIADDEALSTNELIRMMAEIMGKRVRIWNVPAGLVRWLARAGDVLHLPLNSERLKKLTESYVVSNTEVKKAMGWGKMPVSLRDGMTKTLESFSRKGAKTPGK